MKITCKNCDRYLMEAKGTTIVEGLICPSCKSRLNVKVVTAESSMADLSYKFTEPETIKPRHQ